MTKFILNLILNLNLTLCININSMDFFYPKKNKLLEKFSLSTLAARSYVRDLFYRYNGNKEKIEDEIKKIYPIEVRIAIAKQYFFIFGDVDVHDLTLEEAQRKRENQFLEIGYYYGFTIQELVDNNKIPQIVKDSINKGIPIFHILDLRFLKIISIKGLTKIQEFDTITDIYLDNNEIRKIKERDFPESTNIIFISINNNKISEIDINVFRKLPNLGEFFLSENLISDKKKQELHLNLPNTNVYFK